MRQVRIGREVWEVLAIADELGRSVWDDLWGTELGTGGQKNMRTTLKREVPLNGPPRNKRKCRLLKDDICEFKEPRCRVLWFYGTGKQVVCTHVTPKMKTKEFQAEIARASRMRRLYLEAKESRKLGEPEPAKEYS